MAAHLLLATAASMLVPTAHPAPVDVAYEQLRSGDADAAIRHLEECKDMEADDPARLINLGTAYSQKGRFADAERMFRAAIASEERYRLELADGSWVDSRDAARLALARLQERSSLAMR